MVGLILRVAKRLAGQGNRSGERSLKLRENMLRDAEDYLSCQIEQKQWHNDEQSRPHPPRDQRRKGKIPSRWR